MKPSFASTDLLDSLGYAYFELDLTGRLTYGNRIFFSTLGYQPGELLGKHFRRYVDRRQVSLMFNIFSMIHKTGIVEKKLPIDFVIRDGSVHTAEGSIALIRDESGNPVGFRSILLDITERKQKETTIIRAKKQAERELEIARDIQSSFLVKDYPQPEGWEIATHIRPARQVSGDFYDVFPIATSKQIALIMADVCDKGVGAAMYMAIFRSLFRAYSDQQYIMRWSGAPTDILGETATGMFRRDAVLASGAPSLKNAIDLTNNYIATHHGSSNMFATVFFGLLDPESGELLYINAGHESPFLISSGQLKARLDPTGPAVGMLPDLDFQIQRVTLSPGDSLLLYTDGITDALSPAQEQFSEPRLIEAVTSPAPSAQSLIQNIMRELDAHISRREQYDDVTLLAVHRQPVKNM
ncbi:MAG TPA: SpoIIE family protein phosphatase [Anaerolineales bacterium]|nr:SpoIIE family protein phosphatase [Anaerolineales bacterium]